MRRAEQEVECQAPVCEVCEEGEGVPAAGGIGVRGVPAEDEEDGDKDVEGDEEANGGEEDRGEKPGGCVTGRRVEGWVGGDAEERVKGGHDRFLGKVEERRGR